MKTCIYSFCDVQWVTKKVVNRYCVLLDARFPAAEPRIDVSHPRQASPAVVEWHIPIPSMVMSVNCRWTRYRREFCQHTSSWFFSSGTQDWLNGSTSLGCVSFVAVFTKIWDDRHTGEAFRAVFLIHGKDKRNQKNGLCRLIHNQSFSIVTLLIFVITHWFCVVRQKEASDTQSWCMKLSGQRYCFFDGSLPVECWLD